ncbi:MAG: DUF4386 domain-containing protein [bacterium]|nr:DUF4386 domain-containing protein [bacterium]
MSTQLPASSTQRFSAWLLIAHVVLLFAAFSALAPAFDFPEVLRLPADEILQRFRARQSLIVAVYYAFTLSGLTFASLALLLQAVFEPDDPALARLTCKAGVLAGFCQALGFIRWCFVVPVLSEIAADPAASVARREAAVVTFEALHHYAGVAVGENLAFVLQGFWTLGLGALLARSHRFDRRLGWLGMGIGALIALYSVEQFGGRFAVLGPLNVVMHDLWAVWLLLIASQLLRGARTGTTPGIRITRRGWIVALGLLLGLLVVTHL